MIFSRRFNLSFFTFLVFGSALLFSLLFFVISVFPDISIFFRNLAGNAVSCNCSSVLSFTTHPFFHSFLILSFFSSCALLFTFFFFLFEHFYKNLKLHRFLRRHEAPLPVSLLPLLQRHRLEHSILFIHNTRPSLFCFGLLRSKIVIFEGALKLLTDEEIEAALLHEKRHLFAHDPLRLMLSDIFFKTFFWLPGWKQLNHFLHQSCEFAADEFSLSRHHSPKLLAGAMLKCIDTTHEGISAALSNQLESRLAYLLERRMPAHYFSARFFGFIIVLFFAALTLFFSQGYTVLAAFSPKEDASALQCELLRPQNPLFSPVTPMSLQREFISKKQLDVCK